jgi:hypothetical protein
MFELEGSPCEAGQECKGGVKVLLHFDRAKTALPSRETPFCDVDDVKVLLQRKKFRGVYSSATEARTRQCVARQHVTKQTGEGLLHSRCNAASGCLSNRAFFPSATQIFPSAPLHDRNAKKLFVWVRLLG